VTRSDQSSAAVSAGVRRAVTRAGAPVTVSVHALADVGYAWSRDDLTSTTPEIRRGEALGPGVSFGLAVERELTSGLSLRVATPLFAARWNRWSSDGSVNGKVTGDSGGVGLVLAPSLELRLAF
jgi:hypothetical protein